MTVVFAGQPWFTTTTDDSPGARPATVKVILPPFDWQKCSRMRPGCADLRHPMGAPEILPMLKHVAFAIALVACSIT